MAISISAAAAATKTLSLSSTSGRRPVSPSSLASSSSLLFDERSKRAGFGLTIDAHRRGHVRRRGMSCNCLFGLGVPELVVIAGVTALVFGPKKLPEVGRSFGKTIKSFQQAAKEFESELKKEPESNDEPPLDKAIAKTDEEMQKAVSDTEEKDVTVSSTR